MSQQHKHDAIDEEFEQFDKYEQVANPDGRFDDSGDDDVFSDEDCDE